MKQPLPGLAIFANRSECPDCGHWRALHVEGHCLQCVKLASMALDPRFNKTEREVAKRGVPTSGCCHRRFKSPLSDQEREQAIKMDRTLYDPRQRCAVCGMEWMSHTGYLCPSGETTWIALAEGYTTIDRGGLLSGQS